MAPKMEKSSPEVLETFDMIAGWVPEATRKLAFGFPICVINGNMFMGVFENEIFLRLEVSLREELITEFGLAPFEPVLGRAMREYLVLSAELLDSAELAALVRRAFDYGLSLPAKVPKAQGAKARK